LKNESFCNNFSEKNTFRHKQKEAGFPASDEKPIVEFTVYAYF